jgi:STE24 endopeptidase
LETWVQPGISETAWFQAVTLSLLAISILVLSPWLLMRIFDVRPLPAGPLRDRLEAAARRLKFRYTKILLWNTRKNVANALVTGLFPIPRYVLLSDCLIENLSPEEVEAVFGHEVGHVKHLHMPLFLVFLTCSVTIFAMIGNWLMPMLGLAEVDWQALFLGTTSSYGTWTAELAGLVAIGGYLFLVFGFLSRRCERQADIYGARAMSCAQHACTGHDGLELPPNAKHLCPTGIRTFISALEKVAYLNGIRRDKHSWRHGSIARRVDYLDGLLKDPSCEPRFQRRMTFLRWTVWAAFAAVLIATCLGL